MTVSELPKEEKKGKMSSQLPIREDDFDLSLMYLFFVIFLELGVKRVRLGR